MKFAYPEALWGLLLLAIPVLVHLFSFLRSKKVSFPSIQFLQMIKQETSKQSKFKHLLMLLARCLAVICIVGAFAQPYFGTKPNATAQGSRLVSIFIDNSLSMQSNAKEGMLLDDAKNTAKQIAQSFKPSDKFQLLTQDFAASNQRLFTQAEFLNSIDALKPTAVNHKLSAVLNRQADFLGSQSGNTRYRYVVSDFQLNFADFKNCTPQNAFVTRLVQVQAPELKNVYIDTVYLLLPVLKIGENAKLIVKITNGGATKVENIRTEFRLNNSNKGIVNLDLEPYSSQTDTLSFTPTKNGFNQATLALTDYPITFDDIYRFTFFVQASIPVLVLETEENGYLKSFFGIEKYFKPEFKNINNIDYSQLQAFSAIIISGADELSSGLVQELQKALANGTSILFFAGRNANAQSLNALAGLVGASYQNLKSENLTCTQINLADEVFKGIFASIPQNLDLPKVKLYYPINTNAQTTKTNLLTLSNGAPLLAKASYKSGTLYLYAVALNDAFGNLHKHPFFVPLLYRQLLLSQQSTPLAYVLGKNAELIPNNKPTKQVTPKLIAPEIEIIPKVGIYEGKTKVFLGENIQKPDFYLLKNGNDTMANLAFNYDRDESELRFISDIGAEAKPKGYEALLAQNAEQAAAQTRTADSSSLWRWVVLAAIFWLVIETILDRFKF